MRKEKEIYALNNWLLNNGFIKESKELMEAAGEEPDPSDSDVVELIETMSAELPADMEGMDSPEEDGYLSEEELKKLDGALTALEMEEPSPSLSAGEVIMEVIHAALDVAGLLPVIGEPADFINGVIYAIRGRKFEAIFSFLALLPALGWGATIIKRLPDLARILKALLRSGKTIDKTSGVGKTLTKLKNIDVKAAREQTVKIFSALKTVNKVRKAKNAVFYFADLGEEEINKNLEESTIGEMEADALDMLDKLGALIEILDEVLD